MPRSAIAIALLAALGCASAAAIPAAGVPAPLVDHHKHLMSPAAALLQSTATQHFDPVTADDLVRELDSAGIRRAVVLSVAYWYARPDRNLPDERALVRAENDWTAREVARYPDRLVGFCSVNPMSSYAVEEVDRCATEAHLRGLKVHIGNARIDLMKPEQVARVRAVFRAANARRLPIVVHLYSSRVPYGRPHAEVFLNEVLPEAPDVVVQVAHFAGGGPGYTDPAMAVFADAVQAHDPRTRNLWFDVATVADQQPDSVLRQFAARIRQVGVDRVLFGSDLALPGGNPKAGRSWEIFRTTVPLTDAELRAIAGNVAPYLR